MKLNTFKYALKFIHTLHAIRAMKQYPEFDNYSVDDLIIIAYVEKDDWQNDAVEYALSLLKRRNISDSDIQIWIIRINKEYQTLIRAEIKAEIEAIETESYGFRAILFGFFFWPLYLISGWNLKKDGYLVKAKQRLYFIRFGIPLYLIFILLCNLSFEKDEQQSLKEIRQLAITDSLNLSAIDWSGSYYFIDSSTKNNNDRVQWELVLTKGYPHHLGILRLIHESSIIEIPCTGVINKQEIEFYPDTTHKLFNDIEISYYDKLFSFEHSEMNIMTYWFKMRPFYNTQYNDIGLFLEVTACNNI